MWEGIAGFALVFVVIVYGDNIVDFFRRRQERKRLVAEAEARRALEAQRFEEMKSLLADAVVSGDPNAVKALAPIAEAMAEQMRAESGRLLPAREEDEE